MPPLPHGQNGSCPRAGIRVRFPQGKQSGHRGGDPRQGRCVLPSLSPRDGLRSFAVKGTVHVLGAGRSVPGIGRAGCSPWKWKIPRDHEYCSDSNLRCCTTTKEKKKEIYHKDIAAMRSRT